MEEETIVIPPEDVEIIDESEYKAELAEHFDHVPEVAKPLLKEAKTAFSKIEKALYTAPAFINAVKAAIPDVTLQAVLTDDQKQQIAKGALKLMTTKDGTQINIQDMSDTHLKNTIKYLENYEYEYDMASSCDVDEIMYGD